MIISDYYDNIWPMDIITNSPSFHVGNIPIYGDLILAPMDGISDSPFRYITRKLGSAISYTEFLNAIDIVYGHPRLTEHIKFDEFERPISFQIYDNDPDRILKAAMIIRKYNPDMIDINMGCSSISVSGRGAGAGLLKSPAKIIDIFSKLTKSLDIPVTGKIRLGWDEESQNYIQISKIIEENCGKLLAVHARTRSQNFVGQVNWNTIGEIKKTVNIPVIGNGDVKKVSDIIAIKSLTDCDGVMIGRGALGNPWIFSRLDRNQVNDELLFNTILTHLDKMVTFYGINRGITLFRKHIRWYLTPYNLPKDFQAFLLTRVDYQEIVGIIQGIIFLDRTNLTSYIRIDQ